MITITFNNICAKLETDDRLAYDRVRKSLTLQVPGAKYSKRYQKGYWDGTFCFLTPTWLFPTGLLDHVFAALKKNGLPAPALIDNRTRPSLPPGWETNIPTILPGTAHENPIRLDGKRDYQADAVVQIFQRERGIIQSPTGSGKTMIAVAAIEQMRQIGVRSLFLTHKTELLYQTARTIEDAMLVHPQIIGDGRTIQVGPQVNVGTVQTLAARLKKGDPIMTTIAKSIQGLIIDEAHHGDASTFQMVCNACENAFYRIGLTATPQMKGELEDMKLMAQTGPVIKQITLKDLQDRGLLAEPQIKFIPVRQPSLPRNLTWSDAYRKGIVENIHRNAMIVHLAKEFVTRKLSTLILVNHIAHGKALDQMIASTLAGEKIRCQFIHGSKDTDTRQQALGLIENDGLDILISSTIVDEGVDLPALNAVILAGGWKSPIKLYQRIGRGMRPKAGANTVYVVDFADMTQKHLAKQAMQRFKIVQAEPGFKLVSDFDFKTDKAA